VGAKEYAVKVASIPGSFHAGGELAYVVLPQQPSEVGVRSASGRALQHEDLDGLPARICKPGESASIGAIGP
jgi:hypothetical protein